MISEHENQLADILMRSRAVSPASLETAKMHKLQNGCSLAEAFLNLELTDEESLAMALSKITRVPFASASNNLLEIDDDPELKKLIDPQMARDNQFFYLGSTVVSLRQRLPELFKEQ